MISLFQTLLYDFQHALIVGRANDLFGNDLLNKALVIVEIDLRLIDAVVFEFIPALVLRHFMILVKSALLIIAEFEFRRSFSRDPFYGFVKPDGPKKILHG